MFAIFSGLLMLIGCTNSGDARVSVKVVDATGKPVINETVYMYSGVWTDTFVKEPQAADSKEKTDANGLAEFVVKSIYIGDGGTNRLFVTFDNNGNVNGHVSAYISCGTRAVPLTLKQN